MGFPRNSFGSLFFKLWKQYIEIVQEKEPGTPKVLLRTDNATVVLHQPSKLLASVYSHMIDQM